ncbi:integrase [Halobacteriales archaeon SW_7_68_16]|nr:MAG: integrase [Halobacteriales archaeon SW_7_68_16]
MSRSERPYDNTDDQLDNHPNPHNPDTTSLPISDAIEKYISKRRGELTDATIQSHESRLKWFREFCSYADVDETGDLTRPIVADFEEFRREVAQGDPSPSTMKTQVDTVRVFLKHIEKWGYAEPNIHVAADPPSLSKSENIRHVDINIDDVKQALDYLRTHEYACRRHVVSELVWHTGIRIGAVHSLDVDDIHLDDQLVELRHRPNEGSRTTLKNKDDGERYIAISDYVADMLEDWIQNRRPKTSYKEKGVREPLLTTRYGRASKSTLRTDVYEATWPQAYGAACSCDPHEDEGDCWANNKNDASACVDVIGPHTLRKHAIVHHLDNDWRLEHVSDRVNSEPEVVKDHYDQAREDNL